MASSGIVIMSPLVGDVFTPLPIHYELKGSRRVRIVSEDAAGVVEPLFYYVPPRIASPSASVLPPPRDYYAKCLTVSSGWVFRASAIYLRVLYS